MNQSIDTAIIPAAWGPRGRGAEISFTIVDSPFGRMLVAVTARGICALSVHQSDQWQESELRRDFREAKIIRDDAAVRPSAQAVLRYLSGETARCEVPLDVSGTPFQLSVWRELCAIPDRRDAQLWRDRGTHRTPVGSARRWTRQRIESGVDPDPMPSRDRRERQAHGLSMGPGDQTKAARFRAGSRRP